MSLALHYWMRDAYDAQAPRLLNDLYCVEWDVKLYYAYKGKGPKNECSSYRPTSLLSMPGKVFSHVLLELVQPLVQMTQWPQQSGFTAGCSTINTTLALWLLSELYRQFNRPLYVAFVNIKSAFDSVDKNALWKALRARGIPDILLNLIEDLHTHTGATVRIGNKFCHHFSTISGVWQGCVLAPALCLVAIDWILGHLAPEVHYSWTLSLHWSCMLMMLPSLCLISFKQTVSSNLLMPLLLHWA